MTIGFIGCGNMAQPIIQSIADSHLFAREHIFVYDTDTQKSKDFCEKSGVGIMESETQIAERCDCVVLCVKPQGLESLLSTIGDTLRKNNPFIMTIAAGKLISFYEELISTKARIGRIFPNLNAAVKSACSAYCVNQNCSESDEELLGKICSCFGTALKYPEEMFSQFGVLGGCSPAYTFLYIDSLAKAAQSNGMSREDAIKTAVQAVLGSALYMQQSGIEPDELIDRVCSKGGTTIEGVTHLRENGLEALVSGAYNASLKRDRELSAK